MDAYILIMTGRIVSNNSYKIDVRGTDYGTIMGRKIPKED